MSITDAQGSVAAERSVAARRREACITTSWDDGHPLDLRLADMLDRHGVPATFYIPRSSEFGTMGAAEVRELSRRFEIGAHTLNHRVLTRIGDAEAEQEITGSKGWVEDVTGRTCPMFCPPSGKLARRHLDMAREAGFAGVRTVELVSLDFPRSEGGILVEPTTVQVFSHSLASCARNALRRGAIGNLLRLVSHGSPHDWSGLAMALLDEVMRRGGVFHLWGHSWEIEATGQWPVLEEVLRSLGEQSRLARASSNGALALSCLAEIGETVPA